MADPSDYDTPEELCAAIRCRTIDTRTALLELCEQLQALSAATAGTDTFCSNFVLGPTGTPNEYSLNYTDAAGAPQLAGTFTLIEDTNLTCEEVRDCLGDLTSSDGSVSITGDYETGWVITIAPEIAGPNASGEYTVTGGDAFTVEPSTDPGNDLTLGGDGRLYVNVPTATPADGDLTVSGPTGAGRFTVEHTDSDGGTQSDTFDVIPSTDANNDLSLGTDGHLYINTPASGPASGDLGITGPDASGNYNFEHEDSDGGIQNDTLTIEPSSDGNNGISLGSDGKLWSDGQDLGAFTVDTAPSAAGNYSLNLTTYSGTVIAGTLNVKASSDAGNGITLGTDGRLFADGATLALTASDISGLGDSATKNVSKAAGGVAAGDDGRFKATKVYTFDGAGATPAVSTKLEPKYFPEARTLAQWDIISRVDTGGALQSDTASVVIEYANYADPVTWTTLVTATLSAATKNQATGLSVSIPAKSYVRARLSVAPATAEVIEVYMQTLAD